MNDVTVKATIDGVDSNISISDLKLLISQAQMPFVMDENATFIDEGESMTGWSITNGSKTQANSCIRNTKSSAAGPGLSSTLSKLVQYPPSGKDFLMLGGVRAKKAAGQFSVVWLLSGTKSISIWLGSADAATATPGAISIRGITGTTANVLQVATGVDYENELVEFALHFDSKFNTVNCYFMRSGQPPEFAGRVKCDYFQAPSIQTVTGSMTSPGNWIEHDYLMICKPNIIGIGDSIEDGRVAFSADPSLNAVNHQSTWRAHANLLPGLRNRIVVDKGVPGNTSAQILSRVVADAIEHGPRCIFVGCSNNDYANSVSAASRKANIQATVDTVTQSGIKCALRNSLYGTSTPVVSGSAVTNGAYLNYHKSWWDSYSSQISGVDYLVDVMAAMKNQDDWYVNPAYAGSDGVHPNVAGYTAMGSALEISIA
ncbi:GDSL-type esterase/lipase family protein [Pseudomonas corrugata]|uniref:SGNH/GDSL hydrolase family protein n=1 Tax=Pseudomonas corrugata TaxID=47879 RepID=UPI003D818052